MFKIGDKVTCRVTVEAYYSNYGGNPEMVFQPGMVGIVVSIAPKVRIVKGPGKDAKPDFLVVDYNCPITQSVQRIGLNFCNASISTT